MQQKTRLRLVAILAVGLGAAGVSTASAQEPVKPFGPWLEDLRAEALEKGIRAETLNTVIPTIKPIPRVVELDRRQPEFTLTLAQYLNRVVPGSRVKKGRARYQENAALLKEVGDKFGVQPRFIVAFWGVETDFGRVDGGFSVISSLATLAHDGRRSKFFRGELIRSLRIVDQGHISHTNMKGSWAGAMGQFQFMPSTFESFAIDYDGDGRRDIWRNRRDAFASAANFLSKSGWKGDQTWGREVKLPANFDEKLSKSKVKKTIQEWQSLGVRRVDGTDLPTRVLQASIVLPEGKKGRAFMAYNNYNVILRWNRSSFFAVAIGSLADQIGKR